MPQDNLYTRAYLSGGWWDAPNNPSAPEPLQATILTAFPGLTTLEIVSGDPTLNDLRVTVDPPLTAPQIVTLDGIVAAHKAAVGTPPPPSEPNVPVAPAPPSTAGALVAFANTDALTLADTTRVPGAANGVATLDAGTLVPPAQLPAATESAQGAAEIATQPEADAGLDDTRLITPLKLAGVIASALSGDLASLQARKTVPLALTGAFQSLTLDTVDLQTDAAVVERDGVSTERVVLKEAGSFLVLLLAQVDLGSADAGEVQVLLNGATVVPGSLREVNSASGGNTVLHVTIPLVINAAANDYVEAQARETAGSLTLDNCTFVVARLRGSQGAAGAPGPPGSGTTLNLKVNGVLVPNSPFSVVNLINSGSQGVDAGSGQADLTLGLDGYVYNEALPRTTTSSSTYQNKVEINTPAATGKFLIVASWVCDNSGDLNRSRLQNVTDAVTLAEDRWESNNNNERKSVFAVVEVTLTGASKTIRIEFRDNSGGNNQGCREARIACWRATT